LLTPSVSCDASSVTDAVESFGSSVVNVPVPSVFAPSIKVTVPDGVPPLPVIETVAVSVVDWVG